jgi:hypothetical protein
VTSSKVKILSSRSVVIDGRARGADEIVAVSSREAITLVDEGYATRDLAAVKVKPTRQASKRKPLDLVGAEDDERLLERG